MAKTRIGFDIGNSSMKVAVSRGERIRFHEVRLPEQMMCDGEIAMPGAFSEFLKKTRRQLRIPFGEGAFALPCGQALCRLVTMPRMTEEQLLLNLPYEFSDFIQGDTEQYFCDYAICGEDGASASDGGKMSMMAAAVSKERIHQYLRMFSRGGIKLRLFLPQEMALISLVRERCAFEGGQTDYCFVDLGHAATRITVVHRDQVRATRQAPVGGQSLDRVIAEQFGVDEFLAGSYKHTNYQNILEDSVCLDVYNQIAVEILKVINFYQFTYQDSAIPGIYLIGGGANIEPLREAIAETTGLKLLFAERLVEGKADASETSILTGMVAAGMAVAGKEE